jgi:hypothetical protein
MMVVGLAGTAQAQTPDAAATFAAQARAGGLTTAQAAELRAEVDSYLAELGGRQVAANAIDLNGTGMLVVPVPGEQKVRDLAGSAVTRPEIDGTCSLGDFCVWQLDGGHGGLLAKFVCNSPANIPSSWLVRGADGNFHGSFWNHQTGGAPGFFYGGLNATGGVNFSPPVGPLQNRPLGAPRVDRSIEACH